MGRFHARVARLESRLATDAFPRLTILMQWFSETDVPPRESCMPPNLHAMLILNQRYSDKAIWDPIQESWVPEAELEHVAARIDAVEAQGATQHPASSKGRR